jgi:hypothetical protein
MTNSINKSFILHKDSLAILSEMTDQQAGSLLKFIYFFVQNPEELIHINDELVSRSFLIIRDQIIGGWSRSYSKNGKMKYHWNWQGGITPINKSIRQSFQYKIWRNTVFERDSYQCQDCLEVGGILNAHHIKHFATHPELRFEIDNGLTLCKSCHNKEHSMKGASHD